MRRVKSFRANYVVSAESIAAADFDPESYVHNRLQLLLDGVLRGPRGGRYIGTGPTTFLRPQYDPLSREAVYGARRLARYVRPTK